MEFQVNGNINNFFFSNNSVLGALPDNNSSLMASLNRTLSMYRTLSMIPALAFRIIIRTLPTRLSQPQMINFKQYKIKKKVLLVLLVFILD